MDLPLLLGQISTAEWVASIERGLMRNVSQSQARELATAFAQALFRADEEVVGLLARARQYVPLVLVTTRPWTWRATLSRWGWRTSPITW